MPLFLVCIFNTAKVPFRSLACYSMLFCTVTFFFLNLTRAIVFTVQYKTKQYFNEKASSHSATVLKKFSFV